MALSPSPDQVDTPCDLYRAPDAISPAEYSNGVYDLIQLCEELESTTQSSPVTASTST